MSEELKKLVEDQTIAFKSLKEEMEKGDKSSKDIIEKIQADLNVYEEKNQKIVKDLEDSKSEKEKLQEDIKNMEKKLYRLPSGIAKAEKTEHYKAFDNFIKNGKMSLTADEVKYLRTDVNPDGGYLAPEDYRAEMIKDITEITPMRAISRVISTNRGTVEIPKRTGLVSGGWVGEGGTQTNSESTYGLEVINTKELSVYSISTHKLIHDAAFDITAEIRTDVTESFAKLEGTAFVTGANVNQPEGFLANSSVGSVNSGVANALTADSLIDVTGELKTGYNPIYLLNRKTLANVRTLKDGNGQYLWQPGLAAGLPNQINGYPYMEAPDMPDIAADAYPVAFGDFRRGYLIVDGMALLVIRDDYTLSSEGKVKFNFLKSVGGKVIQPEAIKKIKISA